MAALEDNLIEFATDVGIELKSLRRLVNGGLVDLSSLTTTDKNSIVAAINELNAAIGDNPDVGDTNTDYVTVFQAALT